MKKLLLATLIAASASSVIASETLTFTSEEIPAECGINVGKASAAIGFDNDATEFADFAVTNNGGDKAFVKVTIDQNATFNLADGSTEDAKFMIAQGQTLIDIDQAKEVNTSDKILASSYITAKKKNLAPQAAKTATATVEVSCVSF